MELNLLPELQSLLWHSVRLHFMKLNLHLLDKEIYNMLSGCGKFLSPYHFITNRTNKQTNIQQSSFNNKVILLQVWIIMPKYFGMLEIIITGR